MLTGLNHLTLAVSDLPRSLAFYHSLLQLRLETHVGDLASRLRACREHPYAGMRFYPAD